MAITFILVSVLAAGLIAALVKAAGAAGELVVVDDNGLWSAARRRADVGKWVGLVVGFIAAFVVAGWDPLGRGLALAAPVFALCLLGGVIVGELGIRAPSTLTRSATLGVRRMRDYLPRRLAHGVLVATATLLALLAATTAAGSSDDIGRAGRSLSSCGQSHGPWPGSFYSLPIAIVLALGITAAMVTMRQIAQRPRFGGSTVLQDADEALRRRAGETVTAACGVLICVPLLGVLMTATGGLLSISCAPGWWAVAGWSLLALTPLVLALLVYCIATLAQPARPPHTITARRS